MPIVGSGHHCRCKTKSKEQKASASALSKKRRSISDASMANIDLRYSPSFLSKRTEADSTRVLRIWDATLSSTDGTMTSLVTLVAALAAEETTQEQMPTMTVFCNVWVIAVWHFILLPLHSLFSTLIKGFSIQGTTLCKPRPILSLTLLLYF